MSLVRTLSPIDQSLYFEAPYASETQIQQGLNQSLQAQTHWKTLPIRQRVEFCRAWMQAMEKHSEAIALDLCHSMGRPLSQCSGEIRGMLERAHYMLDIAEETLSPSILPEKTGFKRYIQHCPKGVVFIIAPWNYPYLTSINAIIPAIAAGNSVILKPSAQTPKTGEFYLTAAHEAGIPEAVFQTFLMDHNQSKTLMQNSNVHHVVFTGSVAGGEQVERNLAGLFKSSTLELGGKDPAYIRYDANLEQSLVSVLEGAFYNSGQSCCGIERIYIHQKIYKQALDMVGPILNQYQLGNPLDASTNLGPMIRPSAAQQVRLHIESALKSGAHLIDTNPNKNWQTGSHPLGDQYLHPQVLVDVSHNMNLMCEESFGPVVGIQAVKSDQEAIALMNDGRYGLTAAIYSNDIDASESLGQELQSGTVFINRCDYLDPALSWTGLKDSGRGCALSYLGYYSLTQPKSFHIKLKP